MIPPLQEWCDMSMPLTQDALVRAVVREMPNACTAVLGVTASAGEGPVASGEGWIVTVPFSGAATGRIVVWTDTASAEACARRAAPANPSPPDDAVAGVLGGLLGRLASIVEQTPEGAGLMAGEASSRKATAPDAAEAVSVTFGDEGLVGFRVAVEMSAATSVVAPHPLSDSRLEAVLEVDLPLVVRFGRAVMPLRAVADLSPGAVVDMGRTPDEPVELLVGERLVARGEVVIVGGNYGVRITELTSGRRATDLEARA
jgi:flagellar motor switch protein FliN/FliY